MHISLIEQQSSSLQKAEIRESDNQIKGVHKDTIGNVQEYR